MPNKVSKSIFVYFLCAIAPVSIIGTSAKADAQIVESMACGHGCIQQTEQIGPISRNQYGYVVVPVSTKRIIYLEPSSTKEMGKSWIVADCDQKRVGRNASDNSGGDASWTDAFVNNKPNNGGAYAGKAHDQWRLLCKSGQ